MNKEDLISYLEGLDGNPEIRFASQPNWPFEYSIEQIVEVDGIIYLSEGRQIGYLPGEVKDELGW